ncbi:MAG: alpha/beta hydrolase [Acidimicrobiales bacterium]|nr:alpha/beta hydrolase [Acidimicrobiales bacterium]
MPVAQSNGIEIAYETFGDPAAPTVLLVMGLGSQMIHWDVEFCEGIAARGFHVVRFDNRDMGESTRIDEPVDVFAVMGAIGSDDMPAVPYLLSDMAADAVGLLDHLGVDEAHLFGVSMGGMIVQTVAIEHPQRVRSLTSVMSTTGDRDVGTPTAEAMTALLSPPPQTRDELQDTAVRQAGVWGSPGLYDVERLRRIAGEAWDRGYDPAGAARQLAAIFASGSRSPGLAEIAVPTLVIHGTADTLVQPSGGERTAEVVPDAKLLMIDGMGHDLSPPLWPRLIDALAMHATEHA